MLEREYAEVFLLFAAGVALPDGAMPLVACVCLVPGGGETGDNGSNGGGNNGNGVGG